jgi:hypothetical protein
LILRAVCGIVIFRKYGRDSALEPEAKHGF